MMAGEAIIILLYILSVVPLIFFCSNPFHKKLPKPVVQLYVIGFLLSALGWEMWWTFGWIPPGQGVNQRRCPSNPDDCFQNLALPQIINWVITSLYDAAIVCSLGLGFVLRVYGRGVLMTWHWKVFFVYLVWFVGQNLIVELMISSQISGDDSIISWAPLSPIGPGYNPSIKLFGNAKLTLQNQIPWTLMTPIFYGCCILIYRQGEGNGNIEKEVNRTDPLPVFEIKDVE